MMRAAAALVGLCVLVSMSACRIPADKTVPGAPAESSPTVASLSVTQSLGSGAPATASDVKITHHSQTVLRQTMIPAAGTPAPSLPPLQTGEIPPGPYTISVDDTRCATDDCSGESMGSNRFRSDCDVTVIVAKGEAVSALVHVTKRSCSIEVG